MAKKRVKIRRVGVMAPRAKKKTIGPAEQAARAKYQPAINDLSSQIKQSRSYEKRIPQFYDAYRNELSGIQQATDQRAQAQAQASEMNRQAISSEENAEYKRVHGIDKPVEADKTSQAAAQSRQVAAGVVSGVLGAQRTSTYTAQAGSQAREREKRSGLRKELAETKGAKRAYRTEVRGEIRSERQKARAAAQQARLKEAAFALQQWKAQVSAQQGQARLAQGEQRLALTAQENRRDARLARARIRTSRRGQNLTNSQAAARLAAQNAKAARGSARDAANEQVSRALGLLSGSRNPKGWLSSQRMQIKAIAALQAKGIDARAATIAVQSLAAKKK